MATYAHGDYIKIEIVDQDSNESEWLWVRVDYCDDVNRVVFGWLDNAPVLNTDLKLGQQLAISYDNIRQHKRESDFR